MRQRLDTVVQHEVRLHDSVVQNEYHWADRSYTGDDAHLQVGMAYMERSGFCCTK